MPNCVQRAVKHTSRKTQIRAQIPIATALLPITLVAPELLAHMSSLGGAHILLTGEYLWPKEAQGVISAPAETYLERMPAASTKPPKWNRYPQYSH